MLHFGNTSGGEIDTGSGMKIIDNRTEISRDAVSICLGEWGFGVGLRGEFGVYSAGLERDGLVRLELNKIRT